MTDFEMDKMYMITGRELLALLSLIPDGDEKAKVIVENVAGREKSRKVNESQIDFSKPCCPFCGCKQMMTWHIGHYDKPWIAECCRCQAQGPHADTEKEAIELWNRRVEE